jgi:acyl carrier protein
VTVSVRDIDGFALPPNVEGNISISGPTLAIGYFADTEETDRKFRLLPDRSGASKRAYLTGDLGTQTARGLIFAGRADQQIKVRGHRVEPGEIEAMVHETIGPITCCTILLESKSTSRLVLCIEGRQDEEREETLLRRFEQRLPAHARPQEIRWRKHIPKLPNGKLDRAALAQTLGAEASIETAFSEPKTLTERKLAKIWADVLELETVPQDANFFDLGGDSLKTISLYALAEKEGFTLSPNDIFEHPTLAGLARQITQSSQDDVTHHGESIIRKVHVEGAQPPVILVHANMRVLNHLARALGKDRPVGLKFTHLYEGMTLPVGITIESLASDTILEFADFLQKGPCILVGYSAGCAIIQEMAHQITRQGGKVALLCYLDPPFSLRRPPEERRSFANKVSRRARMTFLIARNILGVA